MDPLHQQSLQSSESGCVQKFTRHAKAVLQQYRQAVQAAVHALLKAAAMATWWVPCISPARVRPAAGVYDAAAGIPVLTGRLACTYSCNLASARLICNKQGSWVPLLWVCKRCIHTGWHRIGEGLQHAHTCFRA
jgi:hypothetical protein